MGIGDHNPGLKCEVFGYDSRQLSEVYFLIKIKASSAQGGPCRRYAHNLCCLKVRELRLVVKGAEGDNEP